MTAYVVSETIDAIKDGRRDLETRRVLQNCVSDVDNAVTYIEENPESVQKMSNSVSMGLEMRIIDVVSRFLEMNEKGDLEGAISLFCNSKVLIMTGVVCTNPRLMKASGLMVRTLEQLLTI